MSVRDSRGHRVECAVVYSLRLRNHSSPVIERIKYGLEHATFPFYYCVFGSEIWPDDVAETERERIERTVRLIWRGDGFHTDGFDNETDEFLDGIGLPKRERGSLIRTVRDSEGRVCKHCGVRGFNRRFDGDRGRPFLVYPNGDEVCCECDSCMECGLGPCEWRGEHDKK